MARIKLSELLSTKKYDNSGNSVYYGLTSNELDEYPDPTDGSKLKQILDVYSSDICYGALRRKISNNHIFVYTHLVFEEKLKELLNKKEMVRWFELAIEHKLLPSDFDIKASLKHDGYAVAIFDIRKVKTMPLLYVYLSTLRYVKEHPIFARMMVELVDKRKIDFFVAFTIASYYGINNSGHHILNISTGYPGSIPYTKNLYDLKHAKALMLMLNCEYPKAKFVNAKIKEGANWRMHDALDEIEKASYQRKFAGLKTKDTLKYMRKEVKNVEGK